MNKSSKSTAKSQQFAPGEHLRVVPLHHPKPSVSIDDWSRRRDAEDGRDLFDGKPHTVPANAHLIYSGGPLNLNAEVFTVFWGSKRGKSKTSKKLMADLNT